MNEQEAFLQPDFEANLAITPGDNISQEISIANAMEAAHDDTKQRINAITDELATIIDPTPIRSRLLKHGIVPNTPKVPATEPFVVGDTTLDSMRRSLYTAENTIGEDYNIGDTTLKKMRKNLYSTSIGGFTRDIGVNFVEGLASEPIAWATGLGFAVGDPLRNVTAEQAHLVAAGSYAPFGIGVLKHVWDIWRTSSKDSLSRAGNSASFTIGSILPEGLWGGSAVLSEHIGNTNSGSALILGANVAAGLYGWFLKDIEDKVATPLVNSVKEYVSDHISLPGKGKKAISHL